jgi:UDP:flavonoid glycosyltransferase YjiC (YdhE family)
MRVLFSVPPALGHILPTVPLAMAFQAAGHQVLFAGYGGPAEIGLYGQTGFATVDVGDGSSLTEMYDHWAPGRRFSLGERPLNDLLAAPATANAELSRTTIGPLHDLVQVWRPDLLVHDSFQGAVPIVAATKCVQTVEHQSGLMDGRRVSSLIAARLGGSPQDGKLPITLEIAPPSLHSRVETRWQMRYLPFHGPGTVPLPLLRPASRPRVLVTLGTVVVRNHGLAALGPLLERAGDLDAEFILPVPDGVEPPTVRSMPSNVRIFPWLPLLEALRHCDAVVHHGGAGTLLAAMTQGVPQLVLPQLGDQFLNAEAAVQAGFALRGNPEESDLEQVARLLHDTRFRAAAQKVRDENDIQPTPAEMVSRLTDQVSR